MKIEYLHKNITKLLSDQNILWRVVGLLALSNVILGGLLFFKGERTILVPPQVNKTMWVEGGDVSKEYLEEMALHMSKLLLDLSPTSFQYNHSILLKYATPEAHGTLKKQLTKEGEAYTKLQLSTHFKPSQITANPQTLEVEVKGTLSSYVAGKHVHDSQETLFFKFTHRGSGLLLESVKGGISHEY